MNPGAYIPQSRCWFPGRSHAIGRNCMGQGRLPENNVTLMIIMDKKK